MPFCTEGLWILSPINNGKGSFNSQYADEEGLQRPITLSTTHLLGRTDIRCELWIKLICRNNWNFLFWQRRDKIKLGKKWKYGTFHSNVTIVKCYSKWLIKLINSVICLCKLFLMDFCRPMTCLRSGKPAEKLKLASNSNNTNNCAWIFHGPLMVLEKVDRSYYQLSNLMLTGKFTF